MDIAEIKEDRKLMYLSSFEEGIMDWLIAEHDRLTAANLDLTEHVLYAERERDEAKEQDAATEKERLYWYDLCGKANVKVDKFTAELARKDEALEDIVNPLARLQREAEREGNVLNGYAAELCKDANFLQHIAKAALEAK